MKIFIVVSYAGHYHQAFRNKSDAMDYIKDGDLIAKIFEDYIQ